MAIVPYNYASLGGGINLSAAKSTLRTSEMQDMSNYYPFGTKLRRRGGTRRLNLGGGWTTGGTVITGMNAWRDNVGTAWNLFIAGKTRFGITAFSGGSLPIPAGVLAHSAALQTALDAASSVNQNLPWSMFNYKNFGYALRKGSGGLVRLNATEANYAGMAAPTAASTIADGGVGLLPAGNYQSVYTYYWSTAGFESDPSPVSNTLALAATRFIGHTGISVSPFSPAGMYRRVYRTVENGSNIYFLVATILDNVTTVLTPDNITVNLLGDSASFENGVPPSTLEFGIVWNERFWATDSKDLYYSRLLLPEAMAATRFLPISPDDGYKIRGMYPLGDRLMVFKERGIHYVVGNSPSTFDVHSLNSTFGCDAPHSVAEADNKVYWIGNGYKVFQTDGVRVDDISTPRINKILDAIPVDQKDRIVAYVNRQRNWYMLVLPDSTTSEASPDLHKLLVYDYKQQTWAVFGWVNTVGSKSNVAPNFITEMYDTTLTPFILGTFSDGHLYKLSDETFTTDEVGVNPGAGTNYTSYFLTKPDDFGYPGLRKAHEGVELLYQYPGSPDSSRDNITLELWYDDDVAARLSRSVELEESVGGWVPYKLPTWTEPGMQLALKVIYAGNKIFDIEQITHLVGVTARRPKQPR